MLPTTRRSQGSVFRDAYEDVPVEHRHVRPRYVLSEAEHPEGLCRCFGDDHAGQLVRERLVQANALAQGLEEGERFLRLGDGREHRTSIVEREKKARLSRNRVRVCGPTSARQAGQLVRE